MDKKDLVNSVGKTVEAGGVVCRWSGTVSLGSKVGRRHSREKEREREREEGFRSLVIIISNN